MRMLPRFMLACLLAATSSACAAANTSGSAEVLQHGKSSVTAGPARTTPVAPSLASSSPPAVVTASASPQPPPAGRLKKRPAIVDDVPAAIVLARRENKPVVVVDVWAPWCHTCLSMKHFVLPDPALNPVFERAVFATVDSDRVKNAPFMERYAVNAWPTFFVLEAKTGKLLGMWEGAASVEELRDTVTHAIDSVDATPGSSLALMLSGQQALARADYAQSSRHYRAALRRGGPAWTRRSEALFGWIRAEQRQRHVGKCAQIGVKHVEEVVGAAVPTDFVWVMMNCGEDVRDKALARRTFAAAQARLRRHVRRPPASASVDDRSDALSLYARVLRRAGKQETARSVRREQLALLEEAAGGAPTFAMAATFDYARLGAYLALGQGKRAVKMLRRRVGQLPDSYEPRARLAQALRSLGRTEAALAAIDGAVQLAYGPRRIRYLDTRADLLRKLGRIQEERAALQALLEAYAALPEKQRSGRSWKQLASSARRRLATLGP